MRFIILIIVLGSITGHSNICAQNHKKIVKQFEESSCDSTFVSEFSITPYKLESINKGFGFDSTDHKSKLILNGKIGEVIGPYESDSVICYFKIVNKEKAYKIRVGNIWIDIERGKENARKKAYEILDKIKSGSNFNTYCQLYSDDKNKEKDCDLGWFYNVQMVEPFASEIIKHKIDDIFVVETKYGYHVVKILGNPYLDLMKVDYVSLALKKNNR